jgi:predicted transcriptional regulator
MLDINVSLSVQMIYAMNKSTPLISNVQFFAQSFYILNGFTLHMEDSLNELLGPSIPILVLDLFLEYPNQWMNLREIARRVNKSPGSVSRVINKLLERELVLDCKVGKVSVVYQLNYNNEKVQALMTLRKALKKCCQ